jgi:hypothetical protein
VRVLCHKTQDVVAFSIAFFCLFYREQHQVLFHFDVPLFSGCACCCCHLSVVCSARRHNSNSNSNNNNNNIDTHHILVLGRMSISIEYEDNGSLFSLF